MAEIRFRVSVYDSVLPNSRPWRMVTIELSLRLSCVPGHGGSSMGGNLFFSNQSFENHTGKNAYLAGLAEEDSC